jgi:hypothetical protein
MAAPEVRAVGVVGRSAGAIAPGLPAGTVAGDLLLMFLESKGEDGEIVAKEGGWTKLKTQVKGNTRLTVLYRVSTTGTDNTEINDSGDHQHGRIIGIKTGTFDTGTPFNVSEVGTQAATKAGSVPGATTTVAETLVVAAISGNLPDANGTAEFSEWANASLASITEQIDNASEAGDGGAFGVATGVKAAAGAYGATTVTCATEAERACCSFAIAPVPVEVTGLPVGSLSMMGVGR